VPADSTGESLKNRFSHFFKRRKVVQETAQQGKFAWWRRIALWKKILAGLALGILAGALLGDAASVFKPLGDIFINAIMMLIVPLVFSTLVVGITSMRDPQKMGRVGARTITLYLVTTAFAISIGLVLSTLLQPGVGG
tara:strand:+ start:71988 stop:72401 length:414 start_codon:yes stop_codon:yes gene_type:complete